jgi:1-acyl-sn-glycerol-3-phosphate acyltransferase
MRNPLDVVRAIVGWVTLGVMGTLSLLIMMVTPGVERRRTIGRFTARAVLTIAGIRLQVTAQQPIEQALPRGCVIVANHTSYLDGLILAAALPPHFTFVVKKEMSKVPLAGLLLRRIGSEFVDRFNRHRGAMDARRMLRRARSGQAMAFFPEGTFSKQPGLLRFHTGAFATAVRAGCPLIPVVIRGARQVLPYNRILPKPGPIEVEILDALIPQTSAANAAADLRDRARGLMLDRLGEPDLAHASHVAPILPANLVERA